MAKMNSRYLLTMLPKSAWEQFNNLYLDFNSKNKPYSEDLYQIIRNSQRFFAIISDGMQRNNVFNFIRRKMGLSYWSLSQYLKKKTKHATNFISNFEFAVSDRARRENADVVVCGHIHRPEIKELNRCSLL